MTALAKSQSRPAPFSKSQSILSDGSSTSAAVHLSCRSTHLESWGDAKRSFKNRLLRVAKTCHILKHPVHDCGLSPNKQALVHIVKGGETLTSISKKYGVSIYAIAVANADIIDLDLVMEGQHLYIPARVQQYLSLQEPKQMYGYTLDRCSSFWNDHLKPESQKFFSTVTSYFPPYMEKHTGYFCILFPALAICIICMIKAFQVRNHRLLEKRGLQKGRNSPAQSSRWRSVLAVETMNNPPHQIPEDPFKPPEADETLPVDEMSIAYTSLEPKYLKFLADCGMGRWGYWRGGAPN